jgi:hypothetical protein
MEINSSQWLAAFSASHCFEHHREGKEMACFRYKRLDSPPDTDNPDDDEIFESDDATIWRRSMLCGDDRPEPYQHVRVYEVTHLPELPPGFVLVRDYDQADEVALEASESRNKVKVHTGRRFRLLEAKRAQRVIQAMGCELIPELYALSKPQAAQMPPEAPAIVATVEPTQDDCLVLLLKAWSFKNCKRERKGENIFSAELPKKSHFYKEAGFKQHGKGRYKKFEELYEELSEDVAASLKFLSMGN